MDNSTIKNSIGVAGRDVRETILKQMSWPETVTEALKVQRELRAAVVTSATMVAPRTVTGVDVAYHTRSNQLVAAAVTLDLADLSVLASATACGRARFPYQAGLLAFRELPIVLKVLRELDSGVDLVVCDGHGIAHRHRFGLACHLGVLIDKPTIGVAKNPPPFDCRTPELARGSSTIISDDNERVGVVLRTRDGVKPVYVSTGHRISIEEAIEIVLRLTPRYRQPETTRAADQLGRRVLAGLGEAAIE